MDEGRPSGQEWQWFCGDQESGWRLPALAPLEAAGAADRLSPFAFVDLGWGRDVASASEVAPAGVGLGFDYAVGGNVRAGVTAAVALADAGATRAGDWTVTADIRLTY